MTISSGLTAADGGYLALVCSARGDGVVGQGECAWLIPRTRGGTTAGEVADDRDCSGRGQTDRSTGEGKGGEERKGGEGRREREGEEE